MTKIVRVLIVGLGMLLGTVACDSLSGTTSPPPAPTTPAAAPASPTEPARSAPAGPAESRPAATPAATPVAKAEARPAEPKPAASPAAKTETKPVTSPSAKADAAPAAPRRLVPTTISVPTALREGPFSEDRQLQVREGFVVSVFGRVPGARSLAMAPWGELLVTQPGQGRIMALRPGTSAAEPATARVLAEGLQCPNGMAFHNGALYVAQSTRLQRFAHGDGGALGPAEVVLSGLPQSPCGPHHYRPLAIDEAGNLFVAFGSSCNVCVEEDPRRGTVWRYAPDGRGSEFARGLRNVVDLAFHPDTRQLWGVTNERDQLGDDVPPDPVGPITEGGDYGWPSCYWNGSRWVADPRVPSRNPSCQGLTDYYGVQAHSAPLGIAFSTATQLPSDERGSAFVGLHGSWNRSEGTGFKVIRVPVANGQPQPAQDFVTGWQTGPRGPGDAWGRPVDVEAAPDGSLFVSDDRAGAVYRITFGGR